MENTTPKKLRAKLKEYLDLAKKETIRIKRRSGQHYILITEDKYNELKTELHTLQKRFSGKSAAVEKNEKNEYGKKKIKVNKVAKKITKKAAKKVVKVNKIKN
jgi:PHD/YefM family antitoxin component YafN of YafNO toxin-antitoxin module